MKLIKKPIITEEMKSKVAQKIDLVKTKVWMLVAPNYFKLLKTRYEEMRDALDERDKEYEADLNELTDENSRLVEAHEKLEKTYNDLLGRYDELIQRINKIAAEI